MKDKLRHILESFSVQANKVLNISEFDKDVIAPVIEALKKKERLIEENKFNRMYKPTAEISMLESLYKGGHKRAKYKPVYNQSVVLLVSYFGSAISDIFRSGASDLLRSSNELHE